MAGSFTQIDLAALTPPDVVETLDFEAILAEMKADLLVRAPELADTLDLESEPAVKLLEVAAYREIMVRQRVNDGARAVMLATATGADLDQLAALYGVARRVITPADTSVVPPTPAVLEDDTIFRARVQQAPEGWAAAGPVGAYRFHALSASGDVKDVSVTSPDPGVVRVAVLSRTGSGAADAGLIDTVALALNAEDIRPLCDTVNVQSAAIQTYAITATLTFHPGPDTAVVLAEAQAAAEAWA
ncbi:baseplate assembly protein, partial [Meridianimarinicoccus zhengii]|uniref:baseplate assembly protein n=1 Tax=Meridianimarinicoccus zhengii TaxID=2056810 RepID=UPI000DADCF19